MGAGGDTAMIVNGVAIDDTFAEAFAMTATRVIITAVSPVWARHAAEAMTGFATSVIGCGVEAGIERMLAPAETPDGRPGVAVLLFGMTPKDLGKRLETRVGQCVLTCPTTAVFNGLTGDAPLPLGRNLRFFGDGFQISKRLGGRRFWRVPVMDGEFLCEESAGCAQAVGGGNFLVLAASQTQALAAAEAAIAEMRRLPNVIMPFPGGIVRSGSKVGSRYPAVPASTNEGWCPTLRGLVPSRLSPDIEGVLEIVVDGLTPEDVRAAMRSGIQAVCALGAVAGVRRVSAGNFDGKLGQFQFHLRELLT